ncbi:MAG: GNAT family N-acetyltransferase [Bacteroidetes bacterium]|nr:GNAT family N-acetyltransferase [Bacteroidota bacterium]
MNNENKFLIKKAVKEDASTILFFIKQLAEYENMSVDVTATAEKLEDTLFGKNSNAECVIGYYENKPVGFALFFQNYSTFLAKPGIYLEDLFVLPEMRGKGFGKLLLKHLAQLAVQRNCGRLEWSVLDWNTPAIDFYKSLEAKPMEEWTVFRLTGTSLTNLANN